MVTDAPPAVVLVFGETVVTVGAGAGEMFSDSVPDALIALESETLAVNKNVPAWLGIPAIAPVPELSVNPVGRCPEAVLQEYGGAPPVAARVAV
jgi:hypothetical protein